ncbi:MAG: aminodeoxychorismate/anthranilate synthase component II [Clostridia bacterium]|nr:aminodeoxychorismate/anthranilate synthase component II [Anaerotignum sp.]NCC15009.1 aminodeoxychorismate/anthranilate synthase component II [Clostridia bacterium]
MIVVIDNFDSFTYNLVQLAYQFDEDIRVFRNDSITPQEVDALHPDSIIISPGPCYPHEAGVSEEIIKELGDQYKILGVCLGHQAICEVYGAKIVHAKKLMHGKQSMIDIENASEIFKNLPQKIKGARYHSLVADRSTIPDTVEVIGEADGEVMAVRVKGKQIYGLQFHPESILSEHGSTMMKNFLEL